LRVLPAKRRGEKEKGQRRRGGKERNWFLAYPHNSVTARAEEGEKKKKKERVMRGKKRGKS